jgi:acyl-CoA reductase-like NAD-dependent aldehyde dehydrogenase
MFDIDGGIGVLFTYASKAKRELPDGTVYLDGPVEPLGRGGTFFGQHIAAPLRGVAVQINAYNFPAWGPLEKLAPAFLAGVPTLIKPASQTAYLTERLISSCPRGSSRKARCSSCAAVWETSSTTSPSRTPSRSPARRRPRNGCGPTRSS